MARSTMREARGFQNAVVSCRLLIWYSTPVTECRCGVTIMIGSTVQGQLICTLRNAAGFIVLAKRSLEIHRLLMTTFRRSEGSWEASGRSTSWQICFGLPVEASGRYRPGLLGLAIGEIDGDFGSALAEFTRESF